MNAIILSATPSPIDANIQIGYIVGVIIALLILGYLVFTLIKPEKF